MAPLSLSLFLSHVPRTFCVLGVGVDHLSGLSLFFFLSSKLALLRLVALKQAAPRLTFIVIADCFCQCLRGIVRFS